MREDANRKGERVRKDRRVREGGKEGEERGRREGKRRGGTGG